MYGECRDPSQARGVRFLELELQVVVSSLAWMLGTRLKSSARAAFALNHCAISLASIDIILKYYLYIVYSK